MVQQIEMKQGQISQESELERHIAETFNERLRRRWQEARTLLCIGLDGEYERLPESLRGTPLHGDDHSSAEERAAREGRRVEEALVTFHQAIIDATADLVCAFKPNIAFYEQYGPSGLRALVTLIAYMQRQYPEIPVLLDAKRGDMGNTSKAYARAVFDVYHADAVTVQPYQGYDAIEPFLSRADRGVFVLCRTSNPGAGEFQDIASGGQPLYMTIAEHVAQQWNANGNCGLVVGATFPEELRAVRGVVGDMPILVPGVGAQGGDLEAAVLAGMDSARQGLLISASRSVLYASSGPDYASAARREAARLRIGIERARGASGDSGVFRKGRPPVRSNASTDEDGLLQRREG